MKKTILIIAAVILVTSMIFTGCTADETTAPETTATTSTTAATSTTPTETVTESSGKYGGTLTMLRSDSPGVAMGWPAEANMQQQCSQLVIEPLLKTFNSVESPWLAESFTIAEDKSSVTFDLRQGVKFHDGTDFNAEAAKWNIDNIIDAQIQPTWTSVDIIDDYTIRVNVSAWGVNSLRAFANDVNTWMVSPTAYELHGKDWMMNNPVGTGPFKFDSFQRDAYYNAVRNDDYWGTDADGNQLPYLDAVNTVFVSDDMTSTLNLKTGTADVMAIGIKQTARELADYGLDVQIQINGSLMLVPDSANEDSPFRDQQVREAVAYAIDRDAVAEGFSYGFFGGFYQVPASGTNIYDPDYSDGRMYDPDKARTLLANAGYPDGFEATLLIQPASVDAQLPVVLKDYLDAVGIEITLDLPADMGAFIQNCNGTHSLLALSPFADFGNWAFSIGFCLGEAAVYNKNWERSDGFMEALNNLRAGDLQDLEQTISLAKAVSKNLSEECSVVPVMQNGMGWVQQTYVMNADWFNRPVSAWWNAEQIWLDK